MNESEWTIELKNDNQRYVTQTKSMTETSPKLNKLGGSNLTGS